MAIQGMINLGRTGLMLPKAYVRVLSVTVDEAKATAQVAVYADAAARENNRQPVEMLTVELASAPAPAPVNLKTPQGGQQVEGVPVAPAALGADPAGPLAYAYKQLKLKALYSAMADC